MPNTFPSNIEFKYPWRKYQNRVLQELQQHLDDNHLHVIAPPGSGKTILGIEVAIRLNKPTLIFAPTIAIRNQWIQRFCDLFLQTDHTPDWISRDIKNPKFLTVTTYQALHAACTGNRIDQEDIEEEFENDIPESNSKNNAEEIIALLKTQNIGTLVVDEAHHLKNEWWKSLTIIKDALQPTIVGLTATPPYDVSPLEWHRYIELNGPVDAEISVPELVVEEDLCPHQDYIFFSRPTLEESRKINEYRRRIHRLYEELQTDETLIKALEQHPIYQNPNEHLDWIYNNLEYYSSTLIFLNAVGIDVSENHLEVIGDKKFEIPDLSYEWIEILLTFYLYKDQDNFSSFIEHQEKLISKLKRNGAMERRNVNFIHQRKINRHLSSSISKLKSIHQIVDFEYDSLRQDLRMVILTDYIRKEFLLNESQNNLPLTKIGVIPIFEQLRRSNHQNKKIGVLTGSVIIIPVSAKTGFKRISNQYGINNISTSLLPYDERYVIINSNNQLKHNIVHIITQVFQEGDIEVLIGTKSLLGEGWDAPAINALILASFVGSYVQSNQMRGRAIRTEQKNNDKTGNIWHLVCIDPSVADGGDDMQLLKRRFKAFVGVSLDDQINIENGIERLNLPLNLHNEQDINLANERMLAKAKQRELLKEKWQIALEKGEILIEEIKIPFAGKQNYKTVKSLYYNRTIKYFLAILGSALLSFAGEVFEAFLKMVNNFNNVEDVLQWLLYISMIGIVTFGSLGFKTLRMYIKYRDIAKDAHHIGEALLASLIKIEIIQTPISKLKVVSEVDRFGAIYCHLEGGTTYDKSVFIKSLQEIVGSVDNPRYLIIRKSSFLKIISQKDYHSVPDIIGRKKKFASFFESQWRKYVGSCQLIYTRTIEGRKLLLKSKIHSLASQFEEKIERVNKWR